MLPLIMVCVVLQITYAEGALKASVPVVEESHDLLTEASYNAITGKGKFTPITPSTPPGKLAQQAKQLNLLSPWPQKYPDWGKPSGFAQPQPCGSGGLYDPLLMQLLAHYMRYLPSYGLGPYGLYGNTGLPTAKPPGIFRASENIHQSSHI